MQGNHHLSTNERAYGDLIAAGRNVYADIGQTEGEWLTGREVTA